YGNFQLSVNGGTALAPTITTAPQSQTIGSGQTTTLSVVATGTGALTYQWYQGASGMPTSPVTGATSSSYTTATLTTTTSYWVRVANAAGTADSPTATIAIGTLPPGLLVQDTFTGSAGTLLPAHLPDVNLTGSPWTLTGGTPT